MWILNLTPKFFLHQPVSMQADILLQDWFYGCLKWFTTQNLIRGHISKKESRFHQAQSKDREVWSLRAASENQGMYSFGLLIIINWMTKEKTCFCSILTILPTAKQLHVLKLKCQMVSFIHKKEWIQQLK